MNADQLRQALVTFDRQWRDMGTASSEVADSVWAAARRWLDLQPEECDYCDDGTIFVPHRATCDRCHGSGRVYKTETVERLAKAVGQDFLYPDPHNEGNWMGPGIIAARQVAVAVLDALIEADPSGKET